MSTVMKDKKQRRSTTPANSVMKGGTRPKSTTNKAARGTTRNMNTLAKLMVSQDLNKHMPKEVKLESPTSFKL